MFGSHVKEIDELEDRIAKVKVINLLIAYPFSIKRYLREEYGTEHDDISCYIGNIPRYSTPSSLQPLVMDLPDQVNLPNSPLLPMEPMEGTTPTNLPLEIAYFLSAYITEITEKEQITNPVITALIVNVNSLVDCLSGFERILRTPIPMAYSVHLNQCLTLFCLSLPFQLLTKFKADHYHDFIIIPIVILIVFTAFGIVNIGEEIENPFGYDANDLPLDEYCVILKKELNAMLSRPPPKVEDWIIQPRNFRDATMLEVY
ncbi:hypothetical protein DSO57_1017997 [Entomophthora muscae]|uniref:Uncharacterized protein n=1 Tax=Entomophthora muscae TaxID=34485 RepID=A0ACC2STI9_9FUNG|nr:hypothetical protein DSO57_1017997 [Entomophthora muscae]